MRLFRCIVSFLCVAVLCCSAYWYITAKKASSPPVISCSEQEIRVNTEIGNAQLLGFVTAYDDKDGNLSAETVVEKISGFTERGRSVVTFAVCDSDNNVSKLSRALIYTDYSPPRFHLNYPLVYPRNTLKFNLTANISAWDMFDGEITNRITVTDTVINGSDPSIFFVTYRVTNTKGDFSELTLPVFMRDTAAGKLELSVYLLYTDNIKFPETSALSYVSSVLLPSADTASDGASQADSSSGEIHSELFYEGDGVNVYRIYSGSSAFPAAESFLYAVYDGGDAR